MNYKKIKMHYKEIFISITIVMLFQQSFCVNMINYFDGDCPPGWKEYNAGNGRVIVGSGTGMDINSVGKSFTTGQTSGEYQHI